MMTYLTQKIARFLPLSRGQKRAIYNSAVLLQRRIIAVSGISEYTRPCFLIIGAQKAGTSSLFHYLRQHPEIKSPLAKELHYFDLNYNRGLAWYLSHFPLCSGQDRFITGEASPYYLFHPHVAERVARDLPEIKLIVLLRDPVKRAFSNYHMAIRRGYETRSFEEAVDYEMALIADGATTLEHPQWSHRKHAYLQRGIYAGQLQRWLKVYPRERFLIIKSETFFADPESTLLQTLQFLSLDKSAYPETKFVPYGRGNYLHKIPEDLHARLYQFYQPHNAQLENLLDINLDEWNSGT